MKDIDIKSLIIGALLASTIFLGVAATSKADAGKWDNNQEWHYKALNVFDSVEDKRDQLFALRKKLAMAEDIGGFMARDIPELKAQIAQLTAATNLTGYQPFAASGKYIWYRRRITNGVVGNANKITPTPKSTSVAEGVLGNLKPKLDAKELKSLEAFEKAIQNLRRPARLVHIRNEQLKLSALAFDQREESIAYIRACLLVIEKRIMELNEDN